MNCPPETQVDRLEKWLDSFVTIEPAPTRAASLHRKMDVLDRCMQLLKQRVHHLQNGIELEDFLGGELWVGPCGLNYRFGKAPRRLPRAIPSILYQPYLLIFLLLYHGPVREVRDTIRELVNRLWDNLGPRDFDTTQKGAPRCVTNVHFAANALRSIGLLRFGKEEAYKTWVLSFPGFVAAARLLQAYVPWDIPANANRTGAWGTAVHNDVLDALRGMDDLSKFSRWLDECFGVVNRCRYPVFHDLVGRAHELMVQHRTALESRKLTPRLPKTQSSEILAGLLNLPDRERFYEELSNYMMASTKFRTVRQKWGTGNDGGSVLDAD